MRKVILSETEMVNLIKKILSEQGTKSQTINLPNDARDIERTVGKTGNFKWDRRTVNLSNGSKSISLHIPKLFLDSGTYSVNGTNVTFSSVVKKFIK